MSSQRVRGSMIPPCSRPRGSILKSLLKQESLLQLTFNHRLLGSCVQLRHSNRRGDGHAKRPCDHLGPHDLCTDLLLRYVHAVRSRGDTEEPATVRMPLCELWSAGYPGLSIFAVLEVSGAVLLFPSRP